MVDSLGVDPVADWILHHHERWDGLGYPHRLRGEGIPRGARILFVADAYDAMTTDRLYQSGLTPEQALAELERCAGSQFDPVVVRALRDELEQPTEILLARERNADPVQRKELRLQSARFLFSSPRHTGLLSISAPPRLPDQGIR